MPNHSHNHNHITSHHSLSHTQQQHTSISLNTLTPNTIQLYQHTHSLPSLSQANSTYLSINLRHQMTSPSHPCSFHFLTPLFHFIIQTLLSLLIHSTSELHTDKNLISASSFSLASSSLISITTTFIHLALPHTSHFSTSISAKVSCVRILTEYAEGLWSHKQ